MAQDFAAAFGLGEDERHIAAVDMAGVSLAAIQALQDQVETKELAIQALQERVATLEALVVELIEK
jgi:hypothetical protein